MTASVDSTNRERPCCTVTEAVWVIEPLATVTVVVPLPRAVIRPAELTVATAESADDQLKTAVIELPLLSCAVARS